MIHWNATDKKASCLCLCVCMCMYVLEKKTVQKKKQNKGHMLYHVHALLVRQITKKEFEKILKYLSSYANCVAI